MTTKQLSLLPDGPQAITIRTPGRLDPAASRIAILAYVGAETFMLMCKAGELDFDSWSTNIKERLADQQIEATEVELKWLQEHLSVEPNLKSCDRQARESLNARLTDEPALPAGALIALFMKGRIKEDVEILELAGGMEPTALISLTEPLHFQCTRGAIFQFQESAVVARMDVRAIPGGIGSPLQEVERFRLETEADFSLDAGRVSLKYPSLNKVFPGIFSRLHLNEGKQNTNRSIYYHAAWASQDEHGLPEYHSLWSIRAGVLQRTWTCPTLR